MKCADCSRLQRLILKKKNHSKERDELQSQFLAHVTKQQVYRDIYEATARKCTSIKHRKYTLSLAQDAIGMGATFFPRYRVVEKNEAQRHELLKTKLTCVIVHGVGTYIFQSFSDLGCQGGNLTLEIFLEVI